MAFTISDILNSIVLAFGVIGGGFAFYQWRKEILFRRFDTVYGLILKIRSDETMSLTFNLIDWNKYFEYDGEFKITNNKYYEENQITNEIFFKRIDELLSIFSYVCYLRRTKILTDSDMLSFNYQLTRILQNNHIRNYLYSLHHWSKSLNTNSSFENLVEYAIETGIYDKDFEIFGKSDMYNCYLEF